MEIVAVVGNASGAEKTHLPYELWSRDQVLAAVGSGDAE